MTGSIRNDQNQNDDLLQQLRENYLQMMREAAEDDEKLRGFGTHECD